ncbi:MAG TPA: EthD family reductase [Dehalococcoidia bacterium]|nr:EthD family reductase [Dehalococcoidia bacterium]
MFWRSEPYALPNLAAGDQAVDPFTRFYRNQPAGNDDAQVFDRSRRWPIDDQHADIFGEENVIIDGKTTPSMVNAIFMVCRKPGLDHRDFFEHWKEVQVPLAARLPGLRRYIQNSGHLEAFVRNNGGQTHDGWSEFWFDDYAAFQNAYHSPEWKAMAEDGKTLFHPTMAIVIGREYVQKDEHWKPRTYGALGMTEEQIRMKLLAQGYKSLASDPNAPARIIAAARKGQLAVWTDDHIALFGDHIYDARPQR